MITDEELKGHIEFHDQLLEEHKKYIARMSPHIDPVMLETLITERTIVRWLKYVLNEAP